MNLIIIGAGLYLKKKFYFLSILFFGVSPHILILDLCSTFKAHIIYMYICRISELENMTRINHAW